MVLAMFKLLLAEGRHLLVFQGVLVFVTLSSTAYGVWVLVNFANDIRAGLYDHTLSHGSEFDMQPAAGDGEDDGSEEPFRKNPTLCWCPCDTE